MGASELGRPWKDLCRWAKNNLPWVCWLCGGVIDKDRKYPDPLAWTGDHVIPVSVDPSLALDKSNIMPAHGSCNFARGNKAAQTKRSPIDW